MSMRGHLQHAAHAQVDVMSAEAMLRAAQEEFAAAAMQGNAERMVAARDRAHGQLDALLDHVERQKRNLRLALLAGGGS